VRYAFLVRDSDSLPLTKQYFSLKHVATNKRNLAVGFWLSSDNKRPDPLPPNKTSFKYVFKLR
jgi:hypothetical protein